MTSSNNYPDKRPEPSNAPVIWGIILLVIIVGLALGGCGHQHGAERPLVQDTELITPRVRQVYGKFCGDQHRKHDHYRRCIK